MGKAESGATANTTDCVLQSPLSLRASVVQAATLDHVLLSLAPTSTPATSSLTRAQSDTTLRVGSSLEGSLAQLNGSLAAADGKDTPRRSSGYPAFGKRAPLHETTREGFFDVFGLLGIPMVVAFLFSGSAVLAQALVQVFPTAFANAFMGTTELDGGEFWVLAETPTAPKVVATLLLIVFALCYYSLAILMVVLRHKLVISPANNRKKSHTDTVVRPVKRLSASLTAGVKPEENEPQGQTQRQRIATSGAILYGKFAHIDGPYHAYYNVFFDVPKLTFQSLTLVTYLRKGFPIPMVAFYAAMLSFNWGISFFRFQRTSLDRALIVPRLFYIFDLFFAVFAPLVVLLYAQANFHFDYEAWQTRTESLAAGSFDRTARLTADPIQLSMFVSGLYHMLLKGFDSIVIKCGLLLISTYKWLKIVVFLIQSNHARQRQLEIPHLKKPRKQSRRHLLCGVLLFICFGVLLLVYTVVAIRSSTRNCASYKNCTVVSYQWYEGESGCPCLAYINRKIDPRTFAEWTNPPDVSDELSQVAKEGQLRTIQLVNRALTTLPEAVRSCREMEILILLCTKTEVLPDWTKELTKLNYLHIEGDFTGRSLKYLRADLFSQMTGIRFIHTGYIPLVTTYPSLKGLVKLQYLAIAIANSLQEVPNLDDLKSLRTLTIVEAFHVKRLPSLHALTKLQSFSLLYRNEMCCNGYITGACDLSDNRCLKRVNELDVVCLDDRISQSDLVLIRDQAKSNICVTRKLEASQLAPTVLTTDTLCGGVLYRQCALGNSTGICFNARMMAVACDVSGTFEKMRRLQVARRVGDPCDPVEEAWLGCS